MLGLLILISSFNADLFSSCIEDDGIKVCNLKPEHRFCFPARIARTPEDLAGFFEMTLIASDGPAVVLRDRAGDFLAIHTSSTMNCTVAVGWYLGQPV